MSVTAYYAPALMQRTDTGFFSPLRSTLGLLRNLGAMNQGFVVDKQKKSRQNSSNNRAHVHSRMCTLTHIEAKKNPKPSRRFRYAWSRLVIFFRALAISPLHQFRPAPLACILLCFISQARQFIFLTVAHLDGIAASSSPT